MRQIAVSGLLGACVLLLPPACEVHCPPAPPPPDSLTGTYEVTDAPYDPELVGAIIEATEEEVVIEYSRPDGSTWRATFEVFAGPR